MRTLRWILALVTASGLSAAETLSNGIILPDNWPPHPKELTRAPLAEPPYLKQPPKLIPIDVGRQLFVDDFLIENTTLRRTHHLPKYHEASPLFGPDKPWEGEGASKRAGIFSDGVWFDSRDQLFKAWYWSGAISKKPLRYATCYATSKDGIHWEKPLLDVVNGTNIVQEDEADLRRNSSTAWLDEFEKDDAKRFKMFRVVQQTNPGGKGHRNFLRYSTSADGIHWKFVADSGDCGDRSTVFYNAHRKVWVAGLREGGTLVSRCRGYYEAPDALGMMHFANEQTRNHVVKFWIGADELDPSREDLKLRRTANRPWDLVPSQLYNLDCIAYESIMLGMFTIWRGQPDDSVKRPKINEQCVGFSRDGFHWSRPDRRAFCPVSEDPNAWNYGNVQSAGGVCLVVGDRLHFYVGGVNWANGSRHADPNNTGLAILRRDGFTSMDADENGGVLTTRPVVFSGSRLFVNVDAPKGKLTAEILDEEGGIIAPFNRTDCRTISDDSTKREVRWDNARDLSAVAGRRVRFRFHLTNGSLYSFWVSQDERGASNGFVAAGGPGLKGPRDE